MTECKVDQLLELLHLDLDLVDFQSLIKSCVEYGVFIMQEGSASTVVPHVINTCLNEKSTKLKGLVLLKEFIPYCSIETYSDNAISWMTQCLRSANQNDFKITVLSLEVFAKLLENSGKFTDVSKEAGKQIVPKFLAELLKLKTQSVPKTLVCLEICMRLYSGPCENQRENILKFLINSLESAPSVVQLAAKCISLLPGLGGGGKQGVTYKASWYLQHESLVLELHEILDQLFVDVTEIQTDRKTELQGDRLKINFGNLSGKNSLSDAQQLITRFTGIAQCLCAMYFGSFIVVKQVDPMSVLSVVCRGLAVTSAALSNKVSTEVMALISVLPFVHVALLQTLESFILCCSRNILSEAQVISKVLTQVIKWTSSKTWPYAMNKPYTSVRMAAYQCFCTWLAMAQIQSCVHMFAEELVPLILSDIYCKKPTVTLTMNPKTMKAGKRQLKKQLTALSKTNEDHVEKLGNTMANKRLCVQALKTLELIIDSTSDLLKPELFKMVEITMLQILTELGGVSTNIPVPYSDADCRDQLYKLLLTFCLEHEVSKYALTFFKAGLNDLSPQVRTCCQSALSSLEKVFHPSAPTLHFPKQQENLPVTSMSEEDVLNMPISALSKKGLTVVCLVTKNDTPATNNKQKIKEIVEEKEVANTKVVGVNQKCKKDPNEIYFKEEYEVPYDSDVEVIEIIDSNESNSTFDSARSDDGGSIYHFSDNDENVYLEDEENFISKDEISSTFFSPFVFENSDLDRQVCSPKVEQEPFFTEPNESLGNDSALKRIKDDVDVESSKDLSGLEDDQPVTKKQKLETDKSKILLEDEEESKLSESVDMESSKCFSGFDEDQPTINKQKLKRDKINEIVMEGEEEVKLNENVDVESSKCFNGCDDDQPGMKSQILEEGKINRLVSADEEEAMLNDFVDVVC